MMCFRDMTFCSAKCGNTQCPRNFTDEIKKQAEAWMKNPPICFGDLKEGCDKYEPV